MTVEMHLGIQLIHLLFTKALEKAVFGLWYAKFHKVRFENQHKQVLGSDYSKALLQINEIYVSNCHQKIRRKVQ